jgi:hypothetical protein
MRSLPFIPALGALALLLAPASSARAQSSDSALAAPITAPPAAPITVPPAAPTLTDQAPVQYDLSGPRIGVMYTPTGDPTSQFGWHFEHSVAPNPRGPWFIVETVLLVGGLERDVFMPSATMIFGVRLPGGFEAGVGPSLGVGPSGGSSALVLAAGQTLSFGGIHVPLNLAVSLDNDGDERVTLLTGWAIRAPR